MADPVEQLGQFPLLQLALATVITIAGAFAAWRGILKKSDALPTAGPGVQWFLDGPIGKIIGLLEGAYRELRQSREDHQRYANENNHKHDEQTALLRDINKKQDEQIGLLEDVKEKLHDLTIRPRSVRHDE